MAIAQSVFASAKTHASDYIPQLNPHPKYFMTVKGKVDPALKNKIKLIWIATYYTTNNQCRKVFDNGKDSFERQKNEAYPVVLNKNSSYVLNIPLDKYLPGFCIWKALDISYKIILANGRTIYDTSTGVSFTLVHPSNIKKVTQVWRCNDSNCSLITDSLHHLFNRPLHRQQSYEYELIIKK